MTLRRNQGLGISEVLVGLAVASVVGYFMVSFFSTDASQKKIAQQKSNITLLHNQASR